MALTAGSTCYPPGGTAPLPATVCTMPPLDLPDSQILVVGDKYVSGEINAARPPFGILKYAWEAGPPSPLNPKPRPPAMVEITPFVTLRMELVA